MAQTEDNNKKYQVQLTIEPNRVVSDGKQEVAVRCAFVSDKKQKGGIKEEIPVTFKSKRLKIDEKKITQKGAVTLRFKPTKPTGKTKISVSTPYGDAEAVLMVNPTTGQWIKDMVQSLAIAFVLAMCIIRPFILQTFWIPSGSMEDTFFEGDRLMATMFSYRFSEPQRGDIIIFRTIVPKDCKTYNILGYKYEHCENYIKRLIGLPGDTVEIRDHVTYVNGKPLKEPYLKEQQERDFGPVTVPKGRLFFMGDNRNNSNDSRYWDSSITNNCVPIDGRNFCGFLPRERIVAKAWVHFWPLDRIKMIRSARYN